MPDPVHPQFIGCVCHLIMLCLPAHMWKMLPYMDVAVIANLATGYMSDDDKNNDMQDNSEGTLETMTAPVQRFEWRRINTPSPLVITIVIPSSSPTIEQ